VLRLINEVKCIYDIIFDGYKDVDFPYSVATVPRSIKDVGVEHDTLQTQRHLLGERSADLVRRGRHRHPGILEPNKLRAWRWLV
jgi:hypothetical protein